MIIPIECRIITNGVPDLALSNTRRVHLDTIRHVHHGQMHSRMRFWSHDFYDHDGGWSGFEPRFNPDGYINSPPLTDYIHLLIELLLPTSIDNDRIVAGTCRAGSGSYGGKSLSFSFFLCFSWLAYLKGSKLTLIFSKFRFRFECRHVYQFLVIAYFCPFKLLLN